MDTSGLDMCQESMGKVHTKVKSEQVLWWKYEWHLRLMKGYITSMTSTSAQNLPISQHRKIWFLWKILKDNSVTYTIVNVRWINTHILKSQNKVRIYHEEIFLNATISVGYLAHKQWNICLTPITQEN